MEADAIDLAGVVYGLDLPPDCCSLIWQWHVWIELQDVDPNDPNKKGKPYWQEIRGVLAPEDVPKGMYVRGAGYHDAQVAMRAAFVAAMFHRFPGGEVPEEYYTHSLSNEHYLDPNKLKLGEGAERRMITIGTKDPNRPRR